LRHLRVRVLEERRDVHYARTGRTPAANRSGYSVSLVIVMTQIGLRAKRMNPDIVHALVGAALLSLLLYPTLGGALLSRAGDRVPEAQMRV
jgi:hypothetical protein